MPEATERHVIPGGTGYAAEVPEGSLLTLTDLEGIQVIDLVLFSQADPGERLSVANTRKMKGSLRISTGDVLWSSRFTRLAVIEADAVGHHDLLASACSPYDYPLRFGERGVGHRSCLANLTACLEPYGITENLIPDPMNVFMRQAVHPDGTTEVLPAASSAGDSVSLRLLQNAIVGMSVCPQDLNPCNGGRSTDVAVQVEAGPRAGTGS
jgi:uncharacterized protein YcgI (DUF1989 family)